MTIPVVTDKWSNSYLIDGKIIGYVRATHLLSRHQKRQFFDEYKRILESEMFYAFFIEMLVFCLTLYFTNGIYLTVTERKNAILAIEFHGR